MKYHIDFDIDFKRNTYPGKLIAFEGIDGSGKTTQVEKVAEILSKDLPTGRQVFVTKNPTDGEIGQFIRKVLSGELPLPSTSFQYLFSADRQVQQEEIIEHLKKGETVITDRYFWSALAYGLLDRGAIDLENEANFLLISQGILSMYHQFIIPDVTLYLEISVAVAMERISEMHKNTELYERKDNLQKICKGYDYLLERFPQEITVVDGEKKVEEVTSQIIKNVARIM